MQAVVKQFFNEKEVTSTLVMDALYSGCKQIEEHSRSWFEVGAPGRPRQPGTGWLPPAQRGATSSGARHLRSRHSCRQKGAVLV